MATAAAASTVMLASIKYRKLFMSARVCVCVGYLQNDHGHDYIFFLSLRLRSLCENQSEMFMFIFKTTTERTKKKCILFSQTRINCNNTSIKRVQKKRWKTKRKIHKNRWFLIKVSAGLIIICFYFCANAK